MMADDQIGDTVYQLRTEVQVDPPLVNVPSKVLPNGFIAGVKANFFQKLIDRDPYFVSHPLVQDIFRLSQRLNIRFETGIGQRVKAGVSPRPVATNFRSVTLAFSSCSLATASRIACSFFGPTTSTALSLYSFKAVSEMV